MSFLLSEILNITSPMITSIFYMMEYLFQYFVVFVTHFIENPLHLLITSFVIFIIYYFTTPYDKTVDDAEIRYTGKFSKNGQKISYLQNLESTDLSDLPPLYPNGWTPLMESKHLAIGQAVPITALGQQFVIFRGKTGKSFVLDAYCPHLGANLGVCGKVYDDCIQCPFHGWTFSGHDGSCVKIPYADKVPDFAKTKTWLSIEQNGFIYVWYHADGQQPSWIPPVIPEIEQGLWNYSGRLQHTINCHIQIGPGIGYVYFNSKFGKLVQILGTTPESPFKNKMVQHFYSDSRFSFIFAKIIQIISRYMIERDILMWNHKKYLKTPLLVSEDKSIGKFRKWYSQFYSENSCRWNKKTLNW